MSGSSYYKPLGHRKNCNCHQCKLVREWEKQQHHRKLAPLRKRKKEAKPKKIDVVETMNKIERREALEEAKKSDEQQMNKMDSFQKYHDIMLSEFGINTERKKIKS